MLASAALPKAVAASAFALDVRPNATPYLPAAREPGPSAIADSPVA